MNVGDRVEDTRCKSIFAPDPNDRFSGIFGEVIEVSNEFFRVKWEPDDKGKSYTMGYHYSFIAMGIRKVVSGNTVGQDR